MSINALKKELFWSRLIILIIFFGAMACDQVMNADYQKAMAELKSKTIIIDNLQVRIADIMPSCLSGNKTH
jgi:hypothetical protein